MKLNASGTTVSAQNAVPTATINIGVGKCHFNIQHSDVIAITRRTRKQCKILGIALSDDIIDPRVLAISAVL